MYSTGSAEWKRRTDCDRYPLSTAFQLLCCKVSSSNLCFQLRFDFEGAKSNSAVERDPTINLTYLSRCSLFERFFVNLLFTKHRSLNTVHWTVCWTSQIDHNQTRHTGFGNLVTKAVKPMIMIMFIRMLILAINCGSSCCPSLGLLMSSTRASKPYLSLIQALSKPHPSLI